MRISILVVFVLFSLSANAQILWKIKDPMKKQEGYLMGTIHMLPKADREQFDMPDSLIRTMDKVVLELNPDLMLEDRFELASSMVIPERKSIPDLISDTLLKRLDGLFIDTFGIKRKRLYNQYYNLKPMYLSMIVMTEQIGEFSAIDDEVAKIASKAKVEVVGLESVYEQVGFLNAITLEEQLKWLDEMDASMMDDYYELVRFYMKGDLDSIAISSADQMSSEMEQNLAIDRNRNWIPRIKEHLEGGKTFIAVGSLHLPGKEGLIELLRAEGYTVEPAVQ